MARAAIMPLSIFIFFIKDEIKSGRRGNNGGI
jgi:hypothetical protein